MSRKAIIILALVLLLLFGFAGTAAAEEGSADPGSGSSAQEKDSGGTSTDSADSGSAADSGSFSGGSLFDSGGQDSFSSSPSVSSEPDSYSSDYSAPQEQVYTEPAPTTADSGAETEPSAYGSEGSTEPEPDTAGSGSFSDSELGQVSGENGLPQPEPASSTDPPPIEGNADGSGNSSSQDAIDPPTVDQSPQGPQADPDDELFEEGDTAETPAPVDPYFYDADGLLYSIYGGTGVDDPGARTYYSGSQNPIQYAIDFISAEGIVLNDAGVIYVESGIYSGNVTVDGLLPYLSAIKGLKYDYDNHPADPLPTIRGNVNISNLGSGFILEGFNVTGTIAITDVTGPLTLKDLSGNVVLTRVACNGNTGGYGADIENKTRGNVTINNGSFDNNNTYGLKIETGGIVTINGISASYNSGGHGFEAKGYSRLTATNGVFSGNTGCGLSAESPLLAPVTMSSIYACGNTLDGVKLQGRSNYLLTDVNALGNSGNGIFANNSSYQGVDGVGTITVRSSKAGVYTNVSGNSLSGLFLQSKGVVTVSDVTANNNSGDGIYVANYTATAARAVNLTRGTFNDNDASGIIILTKGTVTITDVTASGNGSANNHHGLYINNWGDTEGYLWTGSGSVTVRSSRVTDFYDYADNGGSGIRILSNGVVTINNVNAIRNKGHNGGIQVGDLAFSTIKARAVSLSRVNSDDNDYTGIYIRSGGAVTLTDVAASGNGSETPSILRSGLYIFGAGNVTIRSSRPVDYYAFTNNTQHGIYISCSGVVTVSNVEVSGNNDIGVKIDNRDDGAARAVNITRGYIHGNKKTGLEVRTSGAVTITDVSTSDNDGGDGIFVNNNEGTANVTIRSSRAGTLVDNSGNEQYGIRIFTKGNVSISDVNVCGNSFGGISIYDNTSEAQQARAVTIIRANLSDNTSGSGLDIRARGAVILTDVSASNNGSGGVSIDNTIGGGTGNVTIRASRAGTGYSFFGNTGGGIQIRTNGSVVISDAAISFNEGMAGLYLPSAGDYSARSVTLTRVVIEENEGYGAFVNSKGAVLLTDVHVFNNKHASNGLFINNTVHDGTGAVTIRSSRAGNLANYSGNTGTGITIRTRGVVAVSDVNASGNLGSGIDIVNSGIDAARVVTVSRAVISGNGKDSGSGYHGLYIESKGAVTLTDVSCYDNSETSVSGGVKIKNDSPYLSGVTIRSSRAADIYDYSGNRGIGIEIISSGVVTVANVNASGNGGSAFQGTGMLITNNHNSSTRNVAVSNSRLDDNVITGSCGVNIRTGGIVTLTNVGASRNDYRGIEIIQAGGLVMRNTLRGEALDISENGLDGLYAGNINGHISITGNIRFSGNVYNGANLENIAGGNVTLSGLTFDGNSQCNLKVLTGGNVTLTNVRADNSGGAGAGAEIQSFNGGSGTIRVTGLNSFSGNSGTGLQIMTDGHVNLRGIAAEENGFRGIELREKHTTEKIKSVLLQDIKATRNESDGVYVGKSDSAITFNNVTCMLNSSASTGNKAGIYINEGAGLVTFINSSIIGNYYHGILVRRNPEKVVFRNTNYFGNNLSNSGGYVNVLYQP